MNNRKLLYGFLGILLIFWIGIEFKAENIDKRDDLEVFYLDVGQGDATLINYLGRYQILIDGGPDGNKLLAELGKVMPAMDKNIEIVILTHPDQDHLSGLIDLVENYSIGSFFGNGMEADTDIFNELSEVLEKKEIERKVIGEGSKITIGEKLELKVFNPDYIENKDRDRNSASVILRMDFGENSFLFTGDGTDGTENDMIINDWENVKVDWLKVGHHGANSSTSGFFLATVRPKIAIISVGRGNRFGHPKEEVLKRLRDKEIEFLRTDELGTITVNCQSFNEKCRVKNNTISR